MTKQELIELDQTTVVVILDGTEALAHLWVNLLPGGPALGFPFPSDGLMREEVFVPVTDKDIEDMFVRDGVIFSKIRLKSEGLINRYTRIET